MQELKLACLELAILANEEINETDPKEILNTAKAFYNFCTEEKENTLTLNPNPMRFTPNKDN